MQRRHFILSAVATVGALTHGSAWAGPSSATDFVRDMLDDVTRAVKASKDPKQDPKVLEIFDRTLDYAYLTTHSLGKHAASLTPEQRKEFDDVLQKLVRASYRKNIGDPSGFAVQYLPETAAEGGARLVQTKATNKKKPREEPLLVDYRVMKADRYLVQDVVTSGVSLVDNYRGQFGRIIKRKGFAGLMEMMRKRLHELEAG